MTKKLAFLLCLALTLGLVGSNATSGATLDLRISAGTDDAEEHLNAGMDLTSSDLELPYEDAGTPATDEQLTGLRFVNVAIPKGTKVVKAYLEIEVDAVDKAGSANPVNLVVEGQLVPNAPAITSAAKNLSSRSAVTAAKAKWSLPPWTKVDEKFQSPDLSAVIQEIVNQDGWAGGNALLLLVRDDKDQPSTGLREAESFDGEATAAPLLHIEVSIPQATKPEPADGALTVTSPLFQWTAGDGAVAHNVYFGTSATLGATDLVSASFPATMYFHVPGLTPGVTYYWRIDEIALDGTVTTGDVWKFQAEPITAWAPSPAAGATDLLPSQTLSWKPGTGAVQHQVFLSNNPMEVSAGAATADKGKIAETKFATGLLATGTTYYWRVDEIDATGKVNQGAVWSFKTADAVVNKIVWEKWLNIGSGVLVSDLTSNAAYPNNPTEVELLDSFQSAVDWADNYGQRLYGWLTPPQSGDYTFWIAGDDAQELWLSTSDDATKAVLIASVSGWTPALDFDNTGGGIGGTNQKSAPVKLEAGKKYYIMALGKEGGGGDSTAVAWQGPGIDAREVIAAKYIDTNGQGYFALPPIVLPPVILDLRIGDGADDAEEHLNAGMDLTSTDIELPYEDAGNPATDEQLTGLRFVNVAIPKGAKVVKAYLEIEVDAVDKAGSANPVNLVVEGQLVPNAPAITATAKDLSSRSVVTTAKAKWSLPPWTKVDEKFQSSDLSAVIQEIVNQDGWAGGNALLLLVRDDKDQPSTGLREAEAFNGEATAAPLLHIEVVMP